jgi:membrane protein DedA with SNARE-associated domain
MAWPTFLFWNALGGIAWATSIALGVYLLGDVAEKVISTAGPAAAALTVIALIGVVVWRRKRAGA